MSASTPPGAGRGARRSFNAWALAGARVAAVATIGVTLMVMLGWKFGWHEMATLLPGFPAMTFNTALGLCLLGSSLLLATIPCRSLRWSVWLRDASLLAAGLAGALATLTIMEMATNSGLGIDELFMVDSIARSSVLPHKPGQMSQGTAVSLLLLGVSLGLGTVSGVRPSLKWASILCALCAATIGFVAGVSMLLTDDAMWLVPFFSTMALHTAWIVVLLGCGVMAAEVLGHRFEANLVNAASNRVGGIWLTMTVVVVLAPGVAVTAMVAKQTAKRELSTAQARFDRLTERIVGETSRRVRLPVHGLSGVRGMYAGSEQVSRREFSAYVHEHDLAEEFPGTIGLGFIEPVRRDQLEAFEARERADDAPGFTVHPPSDNEMLYPIKFIDPVGANVPAWGYDVGTEANRREAVEETILTGEPVLTRRITLVQDEEMQPGFLLLQALYRKGMPRNTPSERQRALVGVAYAAMVISGICDGVGEEAHGDVQFAVYEGEGVSQDTKLFGYAVGSGSDMPDASWSGLNRRAMFRTVQTIDVVGQIWTIEMVSSPQFDAGALSPQSTMVAVYGMILSSTAAFFVWLLGCGRADALDLADRKTRDLQKTTEDLRRSSEVIAQQNHDLGAMAERAHRVVDDVSHEFRTPLAVIQEFASIISDGLAGPVSEKQGQYLKIMACAVSDLNHMVEDLLDSSKLRAGRLRVERRAHRVGSIFKRSRATLARKASSRDIMIEEHLDPDLPMVFADEEKVRRVITNLMTNAIKFSPEGSTIELSARRRDKTGEVVVGVTDHGPGLSKDEIDSLFGRFQQTSSGRRVAAKGFGLGLSIAQEMAWLNLGRISVQSEKGAGATFSITLPYNEPSTVLDHYFNTMASIERPDDELVLLRVCAAAECDSDEPSLFLSSITHPTDLLMPVDPEACGDMHGVAQRCWWILGRTTRVDAWVRRIHESRREQTEQDGLGVAPLDVEIWKSWYYPAEVSLAQREVKQLMLGVVSYG